MKPSCQEVSVEKLIAYCDSELPPAEVEPLEKHIRNCPNCQTMLKALQDSLEIIQDIWRADELKWGNLQTFEKSRINRWSIRRAVSIAAGILIICSIGLMFLFSQSRKQRDVVDSVPPIARIEIEAERAAIAAQMLAVGDMYAAQPGAEEYAVERYNDLIASFSGSPESAQAKLRIQKLLERMVQ